MSGLPLTMWSRRYASPGAAERSVAKTMSPPGPSAVPNHAELKPHAAQDMSRPTEMPFGQGNPAFRSTTDLSIF